MQGQTSSPETVACIVQHEYISPERLGLGGTLMSDQSAPCPYCEEDMEVETLDADLRRIQLLQRDTSSRANAQGHADSSSSVKRRKFQARSGIGRSRRQRANLCTTGFATDVFTTGNHATACCETWRQGTSSGTAPTQISRARMINGGGQSCVAPLVNH